MAGNKVVVLGGGVAGLSAAHELAERGFAVEIYEKAKAFGGKARSNAKPNSGAGGRKDLPGEHGFRFFPGFYQHVPDTMRRIPFPGNASGVFDNLVAAAQCAIAQEMKPLFTFLTHLPRTPDDWVLVLKDWFDRDELNLDPGEAEYFAERLINIMTMCDDRRFAELEIDPWWHYTDAANRSIAYQKLLARGMTRSLVAMRAEEANTRTVGSILIQMMMSLTGQSGTLDRVLNAPTSDAWIDPWIAHLTATGLVTFHPEHAAKAFHFNGGKITGVEVQSPAGTSLVTGDFYLAAFPVEVAKDLLATPFGSAAPSLARIANLKTEWMNGLQFYLARDVKVCTGHVICADSPWAVTLISQPQFWSGTDMAGFGDGTVKGLISVDISDWTKPGNKTTHKKAEDCTEAEIVAEVWAQISDHLRATVDPLLPNDMKDAYLDPSITFPVVMNQQPLLVNIVGSWTNRPNAKTEIPNLFLASDYVRTNTDLATMEGANEAGRRAVNEILAAANSAAAPAGVWTFPEPAIFVPLKELDELLFKWGLPHPGLGTMKMLNKIRNFF
jgi:uncharacterized protein with NAD-binding domain and iron-sulfur cluster